MVKHLFSSFLLILLSFSSVNAQKTPWAFSIGAQQDEKAYDVITNKNSNTVVVGAGCISNCRTKDCKFGEPNFHFI